MSFIHGDAKAVDPLGNNLIKARDKRMASFSSTFGPARMSAPARRIEDKFKATAYAGRNNSNEGRDSISCERARGSRVIGDRRRRQKAARCAPFRQIGTRTAACHFADSARPTDGPRAIAPLRRDYGELAVNPRGQWRAAVTRNCQVHLEIPDVFVPSSAPVGLVHAAVRDQVVKHVRRRCGQFCDRRTMFAREPACQRMVRELERVQTVSVISSIEWTSWEVAIDQRTLVGM